MSKAEIFRQKMDWRTTSNVVDCGGFAMRHMETYMGDIARWRSGLATEDAPNQLQQRQLNELRVKYIGKILFYNENENRKLLISCLKTFMALG